MATRGRFFGPDNYFFPDEEEERPESQTSGGGGEIPEGIDDPLNPSSGQSRDRAIAAPNPYDPNPNPMLRALGLPPSPFDFLTGSAGGTVHPGAAVQGGGMGAGRGPSAAPRAGPSFLSGGGAPDAGGLSPDEYLAQQRGTTLQALQTRDMSQDQGYLAAVAERVRGASLNPIQQRLAYERTLADPEFRRQYMIRAYGFDPRTGRMIVPQGYDPLADQGFLQASANLAAQRRAARERLQEQMYGPNTTRQREAQEWAALGFLAPPVPPTPRR